MDQLINVANVLYAGSYLVRDILWLRILTVTAASTLIPYYYTRADPLTAAIYWNLGFTALNVYWIVRLLMERRPVKLTGNDLRLYQLTFRSLTPREMLHLLKLGSWKCAIKGECLIREGEELRELMVICSGRACVVRDGKPVEELGLGQFAGGPEYVTSNRAPAAIEALETTWYMAWLKSDLERFLAKRPELNQALQLTLGFDLSKRLEGAQAHIQFPAAQG